MFSKLIKNATVINEGTRAVKDVLIKDGYIARIDSHIPTTPDCTEINAGGAIPAARYY